MAAERGGADRVELCAGLPEGGTTPSAGMIAAVRKKIAIGVQVMVRPRGGDFFYSEDEFSIMQRDILIAKQLGANGVVFGILNADGNVDKERMRQLIDLARPLKVTCHRAFDMACDLSRALDDLMEVGADRVLTSGGKKSAVDAMPTLAQLVQQAQGRISDDGLRRAFHRQRESRRRVHPRQGSSCRPGHGGHQRHALQKPEDLHGHARQQ